MLPISLQNMGQEFKSKRLYYRYKCKSWINVQMLRPGFPPGMGPPVRSSFLVFKIDGSEVI